MWWQREIAQRLDEVCVHTLITEDHSGERGGLVAIISMLTSQTCGCEPYSCVLMNLEKKRIEANMADREHGPGNNKQMERQTPTDGQAGRQADMVREQV